MSLIDDRYEFRLATLADVDAIMAFYGREWSSSHLLATDRDYFCYQHAMGDRVNFMLAIERASGDIHAAEGFIQYSRRLCDIGAVMWKVGQLCRTPLLGVELVRRLKQATACRVYLGPGANPKTSVPLHSRALGHHVGRLDHFYMLSDRRHFDIARIVRRPGHVAPSGDARVRMRPVSEFTEIARTFDFDRWFSRKPFKDAWYVERRYFDNPIYRYRVFALQDAAMTSALLVTRETEANGARVLRIVDVIGDVRLVGGVGDDLSALLEREGFEYADFYCKGIDRDRLAAAGFACRDGNDPNVIPNYFEPFVQSNVDIWYSLSDDDAVLFKADGDQDRPNARPQLQQAGTGVRHAEQRGAHVAVNR